MAEETPTDLYERILARLPPATLRDSCNDVLRLELDDVSVKLKQAAEAFGRLQEVETAVTQLQQDKEDRRRSASLLALIADTERVQEILSVQLGRLGRSKCPGIPSADAPSQEVRTDQRSLRTGTSLSHAQREPMSSGASEIVPVLQQQREPEATDSDAESSSSDAESESVDTPKDACDAVGPESDQSRQPDATRSRDGAPTKVSSLLERAQNALKRAASTTQPDWMLCRNASSAAKNLVSRIADSGMDDAQMDLVARETAKVLRQLADRLAHSAAENFSAAVMKNLVNAVRVACSQRPVLQQRLQGPLSELEAASITLMSNVKWRRDYPTCLRLALQVHFVPSSQRSTWATGVMESLGTVFSDRLKRAIPAQELSLVSQATALLLSCVENLPPTQLDALRETPAFHRCYHTLAKFAAHENSAGSFSGFQRRASAIAGKPASATKAKNAGGQLQTAFEWATKLNKLPPLDRYAQLNGALQQLKDMLGGVTAEDLKSEKASNALITITACIAEWMRYKPRSFSTKHAARYQEFDRLVLIFSRRIPSQAAPRLLSVIKSMQDDKAMANETDKSARRSRF